MQCRAIIRAVGAMDVQQTDCVIVSDAAAILVCCYACGSLQLVRMLSMGEAGGGGEAVGQVHQRHSWPKAWSLPVDLPSRVCGIKLYHR
jgi:hypothetical protein